MIKKLKDAGISFQAGLNDEEFYKIESVFGFRFPSEIKSFFACGLPIGNQFFNWRDCSPANVDLFHNFYKSMDKSFKFDIENNFNHIRTLLDNSPVKIENKELCVESVLDYLHKSTKLIPFYAHRCFFDGMDNMPIISFWQPTDSIFYGENFEDYLKVEFLGKNLCIEKIPEEMRETGIWYYIID